MSCLSSASKGALLAYAAHRGHHQLSYPDINGRAGLYRRHGRLPCIFTNTLRWPANGVGLRARWTIRALLDVLSQLFVLPSDVPPSLAFHPDHLPRKCMIARKVGVAGAGVGVVSRSSVG